MKSIRSLLFVVPLLIVACVKPVALKSPFKEPDFSAATEGTATISGQAFLRTQGGDVKYGAGYVVKFFPATPYFEEWFDNHVVLGLPIAPDDITKIDNLYINYGATTTADSAGNFGPIKVTPGKYLIWCHISWLVTQYQRSGGYAYAKVTVNDGQNVRVVVTR